MKPPKPEKPEAGKLGAGNGADGSALKDKPAAGNGHGAGPVTKKPAARPLTAAAAPAKKKLAPTAPIDGPATSQSFGSDSLPSSGLDTTDDDTPAVKPKVSHKKKAPAKSGGAGKSEGGATTPNKGGGGGGTPGKKRPVRLTKGEEELTEKDMRRIPGKNYSKAPPGAVPRNKPLAVRAEPLFPFLFLCSFFSIYVISIYVCYI